MRRHTLMSPAALLAVGLLCGCGSNNTYNPNLLVTGPNFTLSVAPASRTVAAGASAGYTVTLTSVNGFSQSVSLTINGLPAGATGSFNPAPVTPTSAGATSTLTISTSQSTTPAGTYTFTVTGIGGGLTKTATAKLVVQSGAAPDFTVTGSGSQTVQQGGTANYSFTVTSLNGFTAAMVTGVTGLPAGTTPQFTPANFTLAANGTQTVTLAVQTTTSTPVGTVTLQIGAGPNAGSMKTVPVTLIVTAASTVPRVIATIPGAGVHGIAVNSTTNRIYAALLADTTTVIDGATNNVLSPITGTNRSIGVGVDSTRNRIYVADEMGHLFVVDGQSNTVIQTVNGVGFSFRVAVNPLTNKIYVTGQDSNLYVVDGATLAVTTIPVAGIAATSGVAVNTVTNTVYVCGNQQVTVINGATNAIVANLPATNPNGTARGVAVDETRNRFYVTNQGDGSVWVYDGSTNTPITKVTIPGAVGVFDVAVDAAKNKIWVADSTSNNGHLINGADNSVTSFTFPGVGGTVGVAANPVTHLVYFSGGNVYVVDGN